MNEWLNENYPQIKNGCVRAACIVAQKRVIKECLTRPDQYYYNSKESLLSYFDHSRFFAVTVKQTTYKNLSAYLDREVKRGALIKTSSGRGSYAAYVFPKIELEKMIDEVILEISKEEAQNAS